MARKILNAATFGLAGAILGGGKKKTPTPTPAPVVMPLADDEAVRRARRKSIAGRRRSGRSSTMLSAGSDTLGGSY